MINCIDCGGEVNDEAVICPHCGIPITGFVPKGKRPGKSGAGLVKFLIFGSFGLTIVGLIMMIIAFVMVGYNMTPR